MALRPVVKVPDVSGPLSVDSRRLRRQHHQAALEVTDLASKRAQRRTQAVMRAAGLGKLDRAVGQTSSLKKRQRDETRNAYGVIFARGGDDSRGGQTLEAYSRGALIVPRYRNWLAFPTDAAPRYVSMHGRRERLTPEGWIAAGLNQKIGKLIFKQTGPREAVLAVRKVSLSPKTGRASKLGVRKPRNRIVPVKDVVVFVLIKRTVRERRFNQVAIVKTEADRMPAYLARTLAGYDQRGS